MNKTLQTQAKFSDILSNKSKKIYGVGFEDDNKSCFHKHLLEQLTGYFSTLQITNKIPEEVDVLIVNVTDDFTFKAFQEKTPPEHCFTILIIHDVSRITSSLLKFADHLIYINELQQYVFEDFLELQYPSTVLPYPFGDHIRRNIDYNNCFIYFEGDHFLADDEYYTTKIDLALQWHPYDVIQKYYFLFEVKATEAIRFEAFKSIMQAKDNRFEFLNARELSVNEIFDLISKSFCAQLFKPECNLDQYIEGIEGRQSSVLYNTLSESPILSSLLHIEAIMAPSLGKSFYNFNAENKNTWANWYNEIENIITHSYDESLERKKTAKEAIEVDTIDDLNVILGKPLTNDFVFSVCFRNQEEKIIRSLESLTRQTGNHDFGIAIISDESSDDSVALILNFFKDKEVDVCFVDNKKRKFVSRNFYNVAHSLVVNDESIIIEVDGDDFLADENVLSTLAEYYKNGALKTNGSYKIYPEDLVFADTQKIHENFDTSNPWSYQYCQSWLHLRSIKRYLLCSVELDYFLEKRSKKWLPEGHDSATQPRMIELAKDKAVFVKEILYCYDRSGTDHEIAGDSHDEDMIRAYKKLDRFYHLLDLA